MAKSKLKNSISKKKKRKFKKVGVRFEETTDPEEKLDQKEVADLLDEVGDDIEDTEIPPPKDLTKDDKRRYKSPFPHRKTFTRYWNDYIPDIAKRKNFKTGHLRQLEILCDLHEHYEEIRDLVKKHGYSYQSSGKNGVQFKMRPEVLQLNRVAADIKNYSKMLGLLLMKDTSFETPASSGEEGDEDESWD